MQLKKFIHLFFVFSAIYLLANGLLATEKATIKKQDLMLAKIYHDDIKIQDYFVSEKLDGVRARWDGKNLISRGGKIFSAPDWFIAEFPKDAVLDGELWSKRGDFENISAIARKKSAGEEWKKIKFWVFDLPLEQTEFEERIEKMKAVVLKAKSPYLKVIPQDSFSSDIELMKEFEKIIADGGEGLMLHKKDALYKKGRSNDLLKLKKYLDAEATVLGYKEGKGKFKGMMGSLKVKNDAGIIFYIGSGFRNEERKSPPAIGSRVTFRYQSLTKNDVPRFPVFIRIRP